MKKIITISYKYMVKISKKIISSIMDCFTYCSFYEKGTSKYCVYTYWHSMFF